MAYSPKTLRHRGIDYHVKVVYRSVFVWYAETTNEE